MPISGGVKIEESRRGDDSDVPGDLKGLGVGELV